MGRVFCHSPRQTAATILYWRDHYRCRNNTQCSFSLLDGSKHQTLTLLVLLFNGALGEHAAIPAGGEDFKGIDDSIGKPAVTERKNYRSVQFVRFSTSIASSCS